MKEYGFQSTTFNHEILSMAIISLPPIQGGQLPVNDEIMCTQYWLIAYIIGGLSLPRNSVG